MRPGVYTVQSWNNKDAVLISETGEFMYLTKSDLPKEFSGELFVGEQIAVVQTTSIVPLGGTSLDERCRSMRNAEICKQQASQRHRDFIAAENERRRKYGVKPL